MTRVQQPDYRRSMAGSALLHGAVLAAALITWPWSRDLKIGTVVPVTIRTNAATTDLRSAVQAPQAQTAQIEAPVPDAPAEAVQSAPQPRPQPAPTPQQPTPTPAPKTPPPKSAPAKSGLDLDALAASLAKSSKSSTRSSAPKGATRPETAAEARPAAGSGDSAAAMAGLSDELQRRWNPNCDVEGGRDVKVKVRFVLAPSGQVRGDVQVIDQPDLGNPVVRAAADRAVRAVYGAAPFSTLPRNFYGTRITVNFDAREACSG